MLHCEILTAKFGDNLLNAYQGNEHTAYWVDGYDWAKVLSGSDDYAHVYYINNGMGNEVVYQNKNEVWVPLSVNTLWSTLGNADRLIWPYWHHIFRFILK